MTRQRKALETLNLIKPKTLRQIGAESQVEGLDGRGELPPTTVRNIHEYLARRKFWSEVARG